MRAIRDPNSTVWIAIGLFALLLIGVSFDLWVGNRSLPPYLRFVSPNAQVYALTGPLRDIWVNGSSHMPRTLSERDKDELGKAIRDYQAFFVRQCIALDKPEDLRSNGVDETRGAMISIVDPAT